MVEYWDDQKALKVCAQAVCVNIKITDENIIQEQK